jgi:hypothetical protein
VKRADLPGIVVVAYNLDESDDKLMACELGLAVSTVGTFLKRALRRSGCARDWS